MLGGLRRVCVIYFHGDSDCWGPVSMLARASENYRVFTGKQCNRNWKGSSKTTFRCIVHSLSLWPLERNSLSRWLAQPAWVCCLLQDGATCGLLGSEFNVNSWKKKSTAVFQHDHTISHVAVIQHEFGRNMRLCQEGSGVRFTGELWLLRCLLRGRHTADP